jgi:protein SCO1/2
MDRRHLLSVLGGSLVGASMPGVGLAKVPAPNPRGGSRFGKLPNYELTTHEGKAVKFYDDLVRGKLVMINFMYTHCKGICPGQTANLLKVQKQLGDRAGKDVFMYSITLEPKVDTPAVLRRHAESQRTGPGWTYLTGKPEEIDTLRRRLGFIDLDPAKDVQSQSHIGVVVYGYEPLNRWAACPALAAPDLIAYNVLSLLGEPVPWQPEFRKSNGKG